MTVTAAQVKELRDRTGAGMMDVKKALVENNGDMNAAIDWLREKGIAKAAKKSGRVAAEGAVKAVSAGNKGAIVEVNSETDFCAKNEQFIDFTNTVAAMVLASGETDIEALKALPYPNSDMTLGEKQTDLVATIGENIGVRRADYIESDGTVGAYIHMGGKIGVLVNISAAANQEEVAKQVAMHIAATNPQFLNRDSMDQDVLAKEKAIFEAQAKESGKPEAVMEKIVIGRMNKFAEENCLVDQAFVMDTDRKVGQVVADAAAGATIASFTRYGLGEGIEKKEENFAAEVAAAVGA